MDSSFNPYLKWLGIPLKHQPPTHYRLLGVEEFEADADIIERAADRQMTYLRSLQAGENGKAAQQLLNEISAAKVCLLDAKRKADYDAKLQVAADASQRKNGAASGAASGSSIQGSADVAGEFAIASPTMPKPAPRRVPTPGNSSLRTAQALAPAPRTTSNGSGGGVAIATRPVHSTAGAPEATPAPTNLMPLVLAGVGAGAFLLLSLVVAVVAFLPGGEPVDVVENHAANNIAANNTGAIDDGASTTSGTSNTNTTNSGQPATSNITTGTSTTDETPAGQSENPFAEPPATVDVGHGGTSTPAKGAIVEVDAPFLLNTLASDEPVLSDRDYTFANVARELRGLDYTRWQYGPVAPFKIKLERNGDIYLILPPDQYTRDLPSVTIADWEETALSCDVVVDGRPLTCRVLHYVGTPKKEISIASSSTIWPILAVSKIHKRARILGDIVDNTTPQTPIKPIVKPPRQGETPVKPPAAEEGEPKPEPTKVAARLKVPSSESQKPVREKLAQLYDIDSLKEPEEKLRVAKNLLEVAKEPSDKPEERYVMIATGAQLAADAGDLVTALAAIDLLAADYAGDTSAMKLHLARMFAKSSVNANVKAQQLAHVLPVIDEGLANDHFDAIDELVKELLAARLRHPELAGRRKIALDMKDTYRKVVAARKTLVTNPDDAAANQVIGEYYCYYKLDWEQGLPHLAKAEDAALKDAAGGDTANPDTAKKQLAVADKWYSIAKDLDVKTDERQKGSLLARAQEWYEKASTELDGLDEAHAKKRLDEVKEELVKMGWVDVPRQATIVAASGYGFQCYLNGERLFSGSYGLESTTATLKRGDVLMFHATKGTGSYGSYGKGFACVIAYEGNYTPVATGLSKGWEGYVPANQLNWYRPDGIASTTPIVASSGSGHQDLVVQTGIGARSIWYAAANSSEAYFVYRVR